MDQHQALLSSLHIHATNSGASTGPAWWSSTQSEGEIISINPTTGEAIASIYAASLADYEYLIQEAQQAFLNWRMMPAPKRGEVIHAIREILHQRKAELGKLISLEMGKSLQEGLGEVQEMIDMADFAVGQSRMLYGRTIASERPLHRMIEQWHPLGVIAVITAFNFPVAVWSWNAFLAAICGNTIIWKPSPKTTLCALAIQQICNHVCKAFGLNGIFSLLSSDQPHLVKKIASDTRIPLLSFTGSTAVGQDIQMHVAKRLGKTLLELSGNNAMIIDESADLDLALPAIVFSAIGTAGQRCTTVRRLFIHVSHYDTLVRALIEAYKKITVGDPLDTQSLMGPLVDQHAVTAFHQAIAEIKRVGGTILTGGHAIQRPGFFVEPTLVAAENDWDIVQRETFAPILYLIKFTTLDEAIQMQNKSRFGLSSAIFTTNLTSAEQFISAKGSDCGIANINIGTSGAEIGGAFGGEKETGGGREAGSDAWQAYMRRQTNTIHWGRQQTLAQGISFKI